MLNFARLAVSIAVIATPFGTAMAQETSDYRLGPQDKLMIRVHTLRKAVGEAYPWPSLTGEFTVGASGNVSMPILGEVKAAGMSTGELAAAISQELKETVGLADIPSSSVEVMQYRPFYVLGAVEQPGRYEYQPGLTVLQALGTARGLVRPEDLSGNERAGIDTTGELRTLNSERVTLLARLARLEAEIADAKEVTFPENLEGKESDPRVAEAMSDERLRFDVRRKALAAELATITQSKSFFAKELETLQAKVGSLDRQAELTTQEMKSVNDLVQKGLAVVPRQVAAESARLNVESNRLDLQVAITRAQQGAAQADRDLVELPARYRREAIDETVATRGLLDQNSARMVTADRVLSFVEERGAGAGLRNARVKPQFELTREESGAAVTHAVRESDKVQPGDVLTVVLDRAGTPGAAAPAAADADPAGAGDAPSASAVGELRGTTQSR